MVGGFLGDFAHVKKPNNGRILVAMFSVLMNVPFMYVIYMGVGAEPEAQAAWAVARGFPLGS